MKQLGSSFNVSRWFQIYETHRTHFRASPGVSESQDAIWTTHQQRLRSLRHEGGSDFLSEFL